jgi:hypothetical protein
MMESTGSTRTEIRVDGLTQQVSTLPAVVETDSSQMESKSVESRQPRLASGPTSAALLAAGIGCLAFWLRVTLVEANSDVKQALNFYNPVGPLSEESTVAVVIWLLVWGVLRGVLHWFWRGR